MDDSVALTLLAMVATAVFFFVLLYVRNNEYNSSKEIVEDAIKISPANPFAGYDWLTLCEEIEDIENHLHDDMGNGRRRVMCQQLRQLREERSMRLGAQ